MKVGIIGLGKLGLPVALAINAKGHQVMGYDVMPEPATYLRERKIPYLEAGSQELLDKHTIEVASSIKEVVLFAELIFVAVQTPHELRFEGVTPIPLDRADFNYEYLVDAMKEINQSMPMLAIGESFDVVVISTVLPGTIQERVLPLLNPQINLCYNPFFIAMGTTVNDFLNPEFVLVGAQVRESASRLKNFYSTLHDKPVLTVSIKEAEMIKVGYNTFIGMKIVFANTMMEIAHKIGADVDNVMQGIKMANRRLISDKYLNGGMGDGGGCHPRDNIAMSWLAKHKLELSHDFFEDLMHAREDQTEWLASLVKEKADKYKLPVIVLGQAFKEETNLTVGSPARLLCWYLRDWGTPVKIYDPHVEAANSINVVPAVYFVATKHKVFREAFSFPKGSIVIDPWRYLDSEYINSAGCTYIGVGQKKKRRP